MVIAKCYKNFGQSKFFQAVEMYKFLTEKLLSLFKENLYPEFLEEEREVLSNRESPIFK